MRNNFRNAFLILVLGAFAAAPASAALITVDLGAQDFVDGQIVFPFIFNTASAGEPAPFDIFRGSDPTSNFNESFTFGYAPIANPLETVISASLRFGILDHDSGFTGSQLASFGVDGNDLTALLNGLFEVSGEGANNQYDVYNVVLPASVFDSLRDGSAMFSLALQGPTQGLLGNLPFNGAGLDFARLTIETRVDDEVPVPEPATSATILAGLLALGALRRRNG